MAHWHISKTPLPLDAKLTARDGEGHYTFLVLKLGSGDMTVEDFLEKHRPADKPSRKASWFMCDEVNELYHAAPGPAEAKVFLMELEPVSPSRHHFAWMALINDVAVAREPVSKEDEELLKTMAENYWSGATPPSDLLEEGWEYTWEILAQRVVVKTCEGPVFKGDLFWYLF